MSFQITVLVKVLAGHPDGRASLPDLRRAVGILISSGTDWTDRNGNVWPREPRASISSARRLCCATPMAGKFTDAGRTLLASIETRAPTTPESGHAREVVVEPALRGTAADAAGSHGPACAAQLGRDAGELPRSHSKPPARGLW